MTCKVPRALAVANIVEPDGETRLELMSLCAHLDVTFSALAEACATSRSTVSRLATSNRWPVNYPRARLQSAIREHLASAGATPEQLDVAFHAFTGKHRWDPPDLTKHRDYKARAPLLAPPTAREQADEEPIMLPSKQTLSPQAKRHFKLFVNPFDGEVTTDEQMYSGGEVSYIREAAWQCFVTNSFVAIIGESGAGKTTILGDLQARITRESQHAVVFRPSVLGVELNNATGHKMKSTDVLHAIITTLDPTATVPQGLQGRSTKAEKLLIASADAGNTHVVLIEEAHSLPDAMLKHLKRIHEVRVGRKPLLGILLLGQPELKKRLDAGLRGGHLREVAQRCEQVVMLPLDSELKPYLEHRAQAAGAKLEQFIEAGAIEAIRHRLTIPGNDGKGSARSLTYPLAVNNYVTRCMNVAAELGVPLVTKEVVQAV